MFTGMCPLGVVLLILVVPAGQAATVLKRELNPKNLSPLFNKQNQLLIGGFSQFHSPIQGRSPPCRTHPSLLVQNE